MAIRCPYCEHVIELKGVKPGQFTPKCPKCQERFALTIPDSASDQPTVKALTEKVNPAIASILGIEDKPARPASTQPPRRSAGDSMVGAGVTSAPPSQRKRSAADSVAGATSVPRARQDAGATSVPAKDHEIATAPPPPTDNLLMQGGRLGGYELERQLGAGGMGAVYLARQVSLNRPVAIKVLAPALASDPAFVARFTREAYAAAQLQHHNVVQIIDIGAEKEINYFSMEFVRGHNLGQLVKENGKLDPETAVAYVLQAARGLQFAHEQGLIHRDIKPDNLMLNDQGILKVADLGLVKKLGTQETAPSPSKIDAGTTQAIDKTQMNVSMGTPAYMPPEQAQDAAAVDQRADVYSLGCTLYHLVTGRPPYSGRTAMEVITKHQREPLTPPDAVVDDVPRSLSSVIQKMLAKKPEQRMQTMREVIVSLEDFLGIATAGPFTPKEEHVRTMEFASRSFAESTWANLRPKLFIAFFVLCGFGAILPWFMDASETFKLGVSGAVVGFAVLTTLAYQITLGLLDRTPIFDRIRQYVFGAGLIDWLIWLIGGATILLVLHSFGLLWWWLGAGIVAVGVAQAFYWVVDRQARSDRRSAVVQADHVLKQMRERGLEENTLRQFVAKHGGEMWEAFFEAMFGYDAKISARRAGWGKERGRERSRWGTWREPIIEWFDEKIRLRRERREAKILARAEAKAISAKGINEQLAMKQAMKNAERYVERAGKLRRTSERKLYAPPIPAVAPPGKDVGKETGKGPDAAGETTAPGKSDDATLVKSAPPGKTILDEEDDDEYEPRKRESYFRRRYGGPLDVLLGAQVRFFLAMIILACFAVWFQQNRGQQALEETVETVNARRVIEGGSDVRGTIERAGDVGQEAVASMRDRVGSLPLRLPIVPERFSEPLGGWYAGLAGMLLLFSCFFSGKTLAVFVLLAAGTSLYAHQPWFPVIGQILNDGKQWIAAAAALGLWLFGVIFLRTNDE